MSYQDLHLNGQSKNKLHDVVCAMMRDAQKDYAAKHPPVKGAERPATRKLIGGTVIRVN